jgi:hypothetical protein
LIVRQNLAKDSASHCKVSITSGYLRVAVDDEAAMGNLFCFA